MPGYLIWICSVDKKGREVPEEVLIAAEELALILTRYRQKEIDCESKINDLLQSAVEAVSNAARLHPIGNPRAYLWSTYRRIVDKFLEQESRLVSVEDEFLEDLVNAGPLPSPEENLLNRLLLERLVNAMDRKTRQIFEWRLEGQTEEDIAKFLNTTQNAVSKRFTRGLKKAKKKTLQNRRLSKR